MQAHIAQSVTTLALCVKVTRTDGQVFGFTEHDRDLDFEGLTYKAATGHRPSAFAASDNLGVDNAELFGILDDESITEQGLAARLWDRAQVECFEVNWVDPDGFGRLPQQSGTLGEAVRTFAGYRAEIRGPSQRLQQVVGEALSPTCRARLGDHRCRVDLTPYTVTGTVAAVTDRRVFQVAEVAAQVAGFYAWGALTFIDGANAGHQMEVKRHTGTTLELFEPMPYDVVPGDQVSVYAGCDKREVTCRTKFQNKWNFQGEPAIPGQDELFRYGV